MNVLTSMELELVKLWEELYNIQDKMTIVEDNWHEIPEHI